MKSWSVLELDNVIASLKALLGARLQEIKTAGNDVVLGFYSGGSMLWLWLDLHAIRPSLLPWSDLPLPVISKKSPLHLFLRAHFDGAKLTAVDRIESAGRAVILRFAGGQELEIRLFPHGANAIARAGEKTISFNKVAPLVEAPVSEGLFNRDLEALRREWLSLRGGGAGGKGGKKARENDPITRVQLEIARKQKALGKVEQELQRKTDMPWRAVGQWLKQHQSLSVPEAWAPFVDKRRKLSWNIEQCFTKAREVEGKIFGTEQRKKILVDEIDKLHNELKKPANEMTLKPATPKLQPLRDSQATGRTLRLTEELVAVAGKNAADNLKLLRKARAWDYWLHLQDQPSSHVILFRNKNTTVSDAVLKQVIAWFTRIQFGKKYSSYVGDKVRVIVTECRHVRPIKGDRLGRVNYQDERVLIYQVAP